MQLKAGTAIFCSRSVVSFKFNTEVELGITGNCFNIDWKCLVVISDVSIGPKTDLTEGLRSLYSLQ